MYPDVLKIMTKGDYLALFDGQNCRRENTATDWAIIGHTDQIMLPSLVKRIRCCPGIRIDRMIVSSSAVLHSDFSHVLFSRGLRTHDSEFYDCSFHYSQILSDKIGMSSFEYVDFSFAHLFCGIVDTSFTNCNFSHTLFDAEITGSSFWSCNFYQADLSGLRMTNVCFDKPNNMIVLPVISGENVYAVNHGTCVKVKYGRSWFHGLQEFRDEAKRASSHAFMYKSAADYIQWYSDTVW